MSRKALILGMYLIALFIIMRNWYSQPGNKGMPYPTTITAPSYLYAVLGIASDFVGGLASVLAVGLTMGLYYRVHKQNKPISAAPKHPGAQTQPSVIKQAVQGGTITINPPTKAKSK